MSDMKEYKKKYYQEHKEKYTKKIKCDICGNMYNLNSKSYHFKSKKHLNALELKKKDEQILKLCNQLTIIKENLQI